MEICSVASLKWLFKDCSFCYLYSIDFTSHTQGECPKTTYGDIQVTELSGGCRSDKVKQNIRLSHKRDIAVCLPFPAESRHSFHFKA